MVPSRAVFPNRMFVTGTGTDIGKTFVSAVLMAGLAGRYWKPIQSGTLESSDTQWIRRHTGLSAEHFLPETYCFEAPLSPHTAAALEGKQISLNNIVVPQIDSSEYLIVEGAGGIMVPLNDDELMLDLIARLNFPTIIVADSGLGTINHTLLTIEQLNRHGIKIFGVVMNGDRNPANRASIERFGQVDVLAEIEHLAEVTPSTLAATFAENF